MPSELVKNAVDLLQDHFEKNKPTVPEFVSVLAYTIALANRHNSPEDFHAFMRGLQHEAANVYMKNQGLIITRGGRG